MPENIERTHPPLTKAEKQASLLGISAELDAEDIAYWQRASDKLRGQTLYQLLNRGKAIRSSISLIHDDDSMDLRLPQPRRDTILKNE